MRYENYALENLKDQLRLLEKEYELATSNEQLFYKLWERWTKEKTDIRNAKIRIKKNINQLEEMERHPQ